MLARFPIALDFVADFHGFLGLAMWCRSIFPFPMHKAGVLDGRQQLQWGRPARSRSNHAVGNVTTVNQKWLIWLTRSTKLGNPRGLAT